MKREQAGSGKNDGGRQASNEYLKEGKFLGAMYCADTETLHTKLVDDQATIEKIVMEIFPDMKKKELDKREIYTLNGKRICNMADHWPWTWVMTRGEDLDVGGDVFILASENARKNYHLHGPPDEIVPKKNYFF